MKNILLSLGIISLPMTGVFEPFDQISISFLIFSIIFFCSIWSEKFKTSNIIIAIFFSSVCIFYTLYNPSISGFKYTIGIIVLPIIYTYSGFKIANLPNNIFYNAIIVGLILSNIFIIYEFTTKNFFPDLFIELPRKDEIENYNPYFISKYIRARGFAEESGHMCLTYELFLPIILSSNHFAKLNLPKKILIVASSFVAIIFTFSPISISFLILVIFLIFSSRKKYNIILFSIFSFILFNIFKLYFIEIYNGFIIKIADSSSRNDRLERLSYVYNNFDEFLFGIGPMKISNYFSNLDSSLNLYLDVFIAYGPLILILLLFIVFRSWFYAFKIDRYGLLISLVIVSLHYIIIHNFWYPFLWILIGITYNRYNLFIALKNENSHSFNK